MEDFQRNFIVSFICGMGFALAWWLMIDILAYYPEVNRFKHGLFYLPISLSTISLFVNGIIPNSSLVEHYSLTRIVFVHRLIFFFSTALGFSGFLAAVIISVTKPASDLPTYALVGMPLLNGLILAANLAFKFGVVDETEDYI